MKKLMKNLALRLITIPLIVGTLSGCGNLIRPREFPEKMIHGVKYQALTQDIAPYKLEEQVPYGDRQYFEKTNNLPNCLPIVIKRFADITRQINLDSGKVELKSESIYIPKRVWNSKKNKWASKITLRTDGPYRTKAFMSELGTKISENEFAYNALTTEEDASFALPTAKILDKEYFFIYVEDSETNENGKLNYYMVPIKGAKLDIKNICGNLYIEGKIYRGTDPKIFPDLFKEGKPVSEITE